MTSDADRDREIDATAPSPSPSAGPSSEMMGSFLEQLWAKYSETAGVVDAISIGSEPTSGPDVKPTPSDGDELVPGRYRLDGELARGGMGAILKVWDETIRRELAMKVIVESGDGDVALMGRFLEEAQITGQLEHPGIVPVHEIGFDAHGRLYFTMRLVRGHDLRTVFQWVRDGEADWTITRALNSLLRVCEAVAYAHSRGVIHRDIKPANVMVGSFGEVYVMDWGLAKVRGTAGVPTPTSGPSPDSSSPTTTIVTDRQQEASRLSDSPFVTAAGAVVGTPAYMSPEQARGEIDDLDAGTDVYAVGALLYTLLTGRMPYVEPGERPTAEQVVKRVRSGPPIPIDRLEPRVPAELVAIGERAMAYERDARYPDMRAMASDLRAFLEQRVVQAYRTGAWAEFGKWIQRNRALATTSGVSLLVVLLGSLTFTWYSDRQYREIVKLEDLKRIEDLDLQADELYRTPVGPGLVEPVRQWLGGVDDVASRLEGHEEALATLRLSAQPYDVEQLEIDRLTDPRFPGLIAGLAARDRLTREIERARATGDPAALAEKLRARAANETRVAGLEEMLSEPERRTYWFADPVDTWRHKGLVDVVTGITRFLAAATAPNAGFDLSEADRRLHRLVPRLAFAETVRMTTVESEEAQNAWAKSIEYLRSSGQYYLHDLRPQVGLFPLGEDPRSGLLEFWHPLTGERPIRDPRSGHWRITEATGMVFVLIPGGSFDMGEDRYEEPKNSMPIHRVLLDPFFISKYEMTQGQWLRFTRTTPSQIYPRRAVAIDIAPGETWPTPKDGRQWWRTVQVRATLPWVAYVPVPIDLTHPVESVSWDTCSLELGAMGLQLPTEAQWEYAARAGTTGLFGASDDPNALLGRGNFADGHFIRFNGLVGEPAWDDPDGFIAHGPVAAFPANEYGLHGIFGNVREWCLDPYTVDYRNVVKPGSGERDPAPPYADLRRMRGGGYRDWVSEVPLGRRYRAKPDYLEKWVGVRPVRAIDSTR